MDGAKFIYVRLTEDEDRQIRDRAATPASQSSDYLIESALSGVGRRRRRPVGTLECERAGRPGHLEGIANNLNQLTKWANANHALPVDLVALTEDLGRAVLAVEQTTSGLAMAFASDKCGSGEGQETRVPS